MITIITIIIIIIIIIINGDSEGLRAAARKLAGRRS